jgi:hypothetical protein
MAWAVIIKGKISDIETLRDLAFAASRKFAARERWTYWEEDRAEGLTFCFEWCNAAIIFAANCARRGIKFQLDWPKNSN